MTQNPIRLLLADDQAMVRAGFRMVLDAQTDMSVIGEAGDGAEAVRLAGELSPDVVLMDIRMPTMDGVEATRRISEAYADATRVLVLTTFDLDEYVYAALQAGASGFLLKDAGPAELLAAIRAVHSGESVVAPSATRRLLERFLPSLPAGPLEQRNAQERLSVLTEREREILVEVGRGLTNSEIAGKLFLAEATVKTHIGHILAKLNLRDRIQMVVLAYDTGLVKPQP
ncbi:LuxR family two component transcriptional regulator [Luteococcus japonicus]|uniref:DNA-binding response regulator, LuxR family n=2 Tax=Luteococcus japonicus TaxID=33984 RepID=A0A1R4IL53_9ACTN|nr:response regulator transcription factor [Luteococcus japonicus]ROR54717.1 LuxR family two component transcriptional regulator [Luteococcus japonicus]SJN20521.1 DNA-binding response regulator, LuxR family [Luteococcus japonicus LSP_Lj1]